MPDSVELTGLYDGGLQNQCSVIPETSGFAQQLSARVIVASLASLSFYTKLNIKFSNDDGLVRKPSAQILDNY